MFSITVRTAAHLQSSHCNDRVLCPTSLYVLRHTYRVATAVTVCYVQHHCTYCGTPTEQPLQWSCVMSSITVRTAAHLQSSHQHTVQLQYTQPSFYAILLYKSLANAHHLLIYTLWFSV
jgi:hypothetical protein